MAYPQNYRYTREHEWIDPATGRVGITDYAQNSLGDIVFVELPKVGTVFGEGKTFGTVESVKSVSDLFAPVSGTVAEINEELNAWPEKINADAHESWIMKLTAANPHDADALLDAAAYERYIAEEGAH
ncbi:MAG TPA: glycine cleavage system protein GcvH [Acidisarcina sp.]